MTDFDITHYVDESAFIDSDFKNGEEFYSLWYGTLEEKPDTEQELLMVQKEYLANRSQSAWKRMYEICQSYMASLIKKRLKNKKGFAPEEIDAFASEATISFMNQYKTRKDFEVGASFAGMMDKKVIEALYRGKNDPLERSLSLDATINDSSTKIEDILNSESLMYQQNKEIKSFECAFETFKEVLDELDEAVKFDDRLMVLFRLYFVLWLRHPRSRHAKRLFLEKFSKDYTTERILSRALLEMRNRLKCSA